MSRTAAILQPNYIPWRGVFDLINRVDVFVMFDDVQYTKKDWRNRNKIKTAQGAKWLTVPVQYSQTNPQQIRHVRINSDIDWQHQHLSAISDAYRLSPHFAWMSDILDELYLGQTFDSISDLAILSTQLLAAKMGLSVEWRKSSEFGLSGNKDGERAIRLCRAVGATRLLNGPSSRGFMNEQLFADKGVELDYLKYSYAPYRQLHGPFLDRMSALDLLFNCGSESLKHISTVEQGV